SESATAATGRIWTPFLRHKNSRIWEKPISKTNYPPLPGKWPARSKLSHFNHITNLETWNRGCSLLVATNGQSSIANDQCSDGGPEHEKYSSKDHGLELDVFDSRLRHTTAPVIIDSLRLDASLAGAGHLR